MVTDRYSCDDVLIVLELAAGELAYLAVIAYVLFVEQPAMTDVNSWVGTVD